MTPETIVVTVDEISQNADHQDIAMLVTDAGTTMTVPLSLLPEGTQHGDVLHVSFDRQPDDTERRKQRILELQRRLFGG